MNKFVCISTHFFCFKFLRVAFSFPFPFRSILFVITNLYMFHMNLSKVVNANDMLENQSPYLILCLALLYFVCVYTVCGSNFTILFAFYLIFHSAFLFSSYFISILFLPYRTHPVDINTSICNSPIPIKFEYCVYCSLYKQLTKSIHRK